MEEPKITEPSKCTDSRLVYKWIILQINAIPYIKQAINCFRKNTAYSEYDFEGAHKRIIGQTILGTLNSERYCILVKNYPTLSKNR